MKHTLYKGKWIIRAAFMVITSLFVPHISYGQAIGDSLYSFNSVLEQLFNQMLPLSGKLVDIGRAIAGFAALWYISVRVWKNMANAESIDFFPLLRPFAIGLALLFYQDVIGLMNGVLQPLETGTREMASESHKAIQEHIRHREEQVKETPQDVIYPNGLPETEKYEQPDNISSQGGGFFSGLQSAFSFSMITRMVKTFVSEIAHILYSAASLCINVIRTFYLLILAILGPIVMGLSVFDGFQSSLSNWFARYIHVYLWLPVANVFGAICSKILENMMVLDGDFLSSTAYIIFMVIAIVGYTTVPTVAGYIVQGGGNDSLLGKINDKVHQGAALAAKVIV
ncbi:conjugative transposon protein TraJ [Edaphocola aurantiacus]|uniref:conjugative transposon protein TraJ n=1 Tax=Edaphocola aurantiacus TaxID=2601682 RepID=UPI001C948D41|nr:conjugative transposon protein TraJ [Edaphocola aurantiacus]